MWHLLWALQGPDHCLALGFMIRYSKLQFSLESCYLAPSFDFGCGCPQTDTMGALLVATHYLGSAFCLFVVLFLQHLEDFHNSPGCMGFDEHRKDFARLNDVLRYAHGPFYAGNGGFRFPCPWLVYECWRDFHDS